MDFTNIPGFSDYGRWYDSGEGQREFNPNWQLQSDSMKFSDVSRGVNGQPYTDDAMIYSAPGYGDGWAFSQGRSP